MARDKDEALVALETLRRGRAGDRALGEGGRRGDRVARAIDERFAGAKFPFLGDRLIPRIAVQSSAGEVSLETGLRNPKPWSKDEKRLLISRGLCAARRSARGRAPRRLGDDFPGIHDPVRVEELLDAAEQRDQVAVLAARDSRACRADAVLAGAGASARERVRRRGPEFSDSAFAIERRRRDRAGTRGGSFRRRRGRRSRRAGLSRRARFARARSRPRARKAEPRHRSSSPSIRCKRERGHQRVVARAPHVRCVRSDRSRPRTRVAPSSSASSRVVARSPATPACVPPNSMKR